MDDPTPHFRRWTRATKVIACAIALVTIGPLVIIWNLMFRMPGKSYAGELAPLSATEVAARDRLRADLHHLSATIGERNVAHPERLALARDWIEAQLGSAGYEPTRQTYDVDGTACSNVVAERKGGGRGDEIVIVGAHYDSAAGSPGANDNGTGVVAVLELARELVVSTPQRTVRFVAFVNEELPYFWTSRMGSAVYAARAKAKEERIVAMLSLETMGSYSDAPDSQAYPFPMSLIYPSRGNFIAFVGNVASRALVRQSIGVFRETTMFPSEGGALPERTTGVGWSDHGAFWDIGVPALMVTDTAFFRYRDYHTRRDTEDKIDVDRFARVVAGLARVVERLGSNDGQ